MSFIRWYWQTTRWVGVLYLLIMLALFGAMVLVVTSMESDPVMVIIATPDLPGVKAK